MTFYQIPDRYAFEMVLIFICNNIFAEMKSPLSPAVNEIILSSGTQVIFLLAPRFLPEFFVDILVAQNCTIPSLSFTNSLRRDSQGSLHAQREEDPVFLSYYINYL